MSDQIPINLADLEDALLFVEGGSEFGNAA